MLWRSVKILEAISKIQKYKVKWLKCEALQMAEKETKDKKKRKIPTAKCRVQRVARRDKKADYQPSAKEKASRKTTE